MPRVKVGNQITGDSGVIEIIPGTGVTASVTETAKGEVEISIDAAGAGGPPSGSAGGDLTGTFPNPTVGAGKISAAKMTSGAAALGLVATADGVGGVSFAPVSPLVAFGNVGYFNVLDYGAIGNGIADDGAAFQSAIDAAAAAASGAAVGQRAIVLVPGGGRTYLFLRHDNLRDANYQGAIEMKSNVELVGVNRPRMRMDYHGLSHLISTHIISGPTGGAGNVDNFAIRGIVFDGGGIADESSTGVAFPDATEDFQGINMADVTHFEFTNNYVTGFFGQGVRFGDYQSADGLVANNYFTLCNGAFIDFAYPYGGVEDRIIVANNIFYDCQANAGGATEAVNFNSPTGAVALVGNVIDKCGWPGVFGTPGEAANAVVTGNVIRVMTGGGGGLAIAHGVASGNVIDMAANNAGTGNGTRAISADTRSTITGNLIILNENAHSSGQNGVQVTGSDVTIAGNTIMCKTPSSQLVDIYVSGGNDVQITGNVCTAGTTYSFRGLTDRIYVEGNRFAAGAEVGSNSVGRFLTFRNNTIKAASGLASALVLYGTNCIIEGNIIDLSASTGRGIWIRWPAANNVIRDNTITGASAVGVLTVDGGLDGGDLWENNTISGGGTLTLASNQTFKRIQGGVNTLTYGTTITTDSTLGDYFKVVVTDNVGFTISNPTGLQRSMKLTYDIKNSIGGGGTVGTITWGSAGLFLLAGAFTNPADTKRRTITFVYDGTNLVEMNRAAADI